MATTRSLCVFVVLGLTVAVLVGRLYSDDLGHPVTAGVSYAPEALVSGELVLVGSRTMSELSAIWDDAFRHIHPHVTSTLDFRGSGTALDPLQVNTSTLGLLSRDLTEEELNDFSKTHPGGKLIPITTGYDALAVIVHPSNPVERLTPAQLRQLFAESEGSTSLTWGDVGLGDEWKDLSVQRFAPTEQSGSRGQFQQIVLPGHDFAEVTTHDWHLKIVEAVSQEPAAIGFVSLANSRSDDIRVVPVAANEESIAGLPTEGFLNDRTYPLIRPLTLVVAVKEESGLTDPLSTEFVKYVLSQHGQEDVIKSGFQPLDRSELLEQYDRLNWNREK